ncbi:hypothetical protein CVD28_07905 [Bacillus sp. M6-12]|uniref:L,D-transpeptidase family protein n=1 Tax=Bacillus sp. M6-12 TaxID=2054166 RepID=UPI000C76A8F3|nr:L,D-transpeptidase family protein [Bacillus sp. M6-12]PLS18205.1 hypothetical protein CVD28_07905 [Bacillus sp. M6-12]
MKIVRLFSFSLVLINIMLFSSLQVNGGTSENLYIKINLWSNELLVMQKKEVIKRFPIASGTEESPTPIGTFKVTAKSKSWGGGFGTRWLGLNVPWGNYGIHGTNKPALIGKNVSSGCIRMNNKDVEMLFEDIPIGTNVYIQGNITGTGQGEYKSLSTGSKGNLVQLVQERLKAMGLFTGTVNGIFDKKTEHAVKQFQKINGLPATGGITFREYRALGLLE